MLRHILSVSMALVFWGLTTAAPLQAGTGRVVALGDDAGYFRDAANVLRWYGRLVEFPDRVDFEFGDIINGQDNRLPNPGLIEHGGGVHVRLDDAGSWGTLAFYFEDQLDKGPHDGAFSALWGRKVGPVQIGLSGRFTTFGNSRVGTEIGDKVESQYFHQYGLGIGGQVRPGFRLEAAGEIVNSLASASGALYHLPPTDDWTTFGLRMRGFITVTSDLTLVPLVDYARDVRGAYDEVMSGPVDIDAYTMSLGVGANLRPEPRTLLLFSCEYRTGRENLAVRSDETGSSTWDSLNRDFYQIRCRAGVESTLKPWLTVRAAVRYIRLHDDQHRYGSPDDTRQEHDLHEAVTTPLSLGLGLHRGRLTADFSFNDTAPLNTNPAAGDIFNDDDTGYSAFTLGWMF